MLETREIDLTGLKCPMPIVRLSRLMKELTAGDELVAVADDPAFCLDVKSWCECAGHDLVCLENSTEKLRAVIRKKNKKMNL